MKKLSVKLENCYGIGKLEKDFDFSQTNVILIYAQNGAFKTSFAKTLKDMLNNKETKDEIYPERHTIRNVMIDDNVEPTRENMLVIDSFDESFSAEKSVTTFMASEELKREYDNIFNILDKKKKDLIKKIKAIAGSSDCEKEMLEIFNYNGSFYEILAQNFSNIAQETKSYDFSYHDIFDDKGYVKKFLEENSNILNEYFEKYNELLSNSTFFKNTDIGSFGTTQANDLLNTLKDDRFFKAQHKLIIAENEIDTYEKFSNLVNKEIDKIMSNQDLKDKFNKIEKQIKNKELKSFKEAIQKDKILLLEIIKDYEGFRKKAFFSFLKQSQSDVKLLVESYNEKKPIIEDIICRARNEQEKWRKIINLFNGRFFVPFRVEIKNQQEVLLRQDSAQFAFVFKDEQERYIDKEKLDSILSMGEKRALYILQILFELESRKAQKLETLLVFDDISDSFDYRNKYAIIEYLHDIKNNHNFKSIVMTHNFDFYRTLANRVGINYKNIFMAYKQNNIREIKLEKGQYINTIIKYLREQCGKDNKKFITFIPFVRNIIEYTKDSNDEDYKKLTSCLHIKNDTNKIKVVDIQEIFKSIFSNMNFNETNNKLIKQFIYEEAEKIIKEEKINPILLENKIVLSIATRIKAEEFMITRYSTTLPQQEFQKNQTRELYATIQDKITDREKEILQKVLMITPENIHINAFMYEPILDTSIEYLLKVYEEISSLAQTN